VTIDEARAAVGQSVVYWPSRKFGQFEEGVITSVNDHVVFVRYGASKQSAATAPEDLILVARLAGR
jgi:hypothetical protein